MEKEKKQKILNLMREIEVLFEDESLDTNDIYGVNFDILTLLKAIDELENSI